MDWVDDQEAWFWDGNIDIVAGSIRFRVHRSVLSAHSELFHDMLSIPQPESKGAQAQDTCPVVEVADTADDMRHFLLALYNMNKQFKAHMRAEFGVVYSIARLAHKYQARSVLEDAVSRIKSVYRDRMPDFIEVINTKASTVLLSSGYKDSLRVLELSRLLGDTSFLRSAYYLLAQDLPLDLSPDAISSEEMLTTFSEDVARVDEGRRQLTLATLDVRQATIESGSIQCYESICEGARNDAARLLCEDDEWTALNAFTLAEENEYGGIVCQSCLEEMKQNEYRAMRRVWEELPTMFDFRD